MTGLWSSFLSAHTQTLGAFERSICVCTTRTALLQTKTAARALLTCRRAHFLCRFSMQVEQCFPCLGILFFGSWGTSNANKFSVDKVMLWLFWCWNFVDKKWTWSYFWKQRHKCFTSCVWTKENNLRPRKDGMSFVPEERFAMARLAVVAERAVGKQFDCLPSSGWLLVLCFRAWCWSATSDYVPCSSQGPILHRWLCDSLDRIVIFVPAGRWAEVRSSQRATRKTRSNCYTAKIHFVWWIRFGEVCSLLVVDFHTN